MEQSVIVSNGKTFICNTEDEHKDEAIKITESLASGAYVQNIGGGEHWWIPIEEYHKLEPLDLTNSLKSAIYRIDENGEATFISGEK
ncbi:hypothetical protein VPT02_009 [Vibrio phage VPT02]|nr:hypothetical protein VPT02_009 [Vibrio phage VPT02]